MTYFFRRFVHEGEPIPDFDKGRDDWYDTKMMVNSYTDASKTESIAYSTEADQIAAILKELGINSAKVTHIFRSLGLRVMEMSGDGLIQEGQGARLGGWNQTIMQKVYSKGVPLQAAMIMAGFMATHFKNKYHIGRSAGDKLPEEFLLGIEIYKVCME